MPQVLRHECAFRRWVWALDFHHWLLGEFYRRDAESTEKFATHSSSVILTL